MSLQSTMVFSEWQTRLKDEVHQPHLASDPSTSQPRSGEQSVGRGEEYRSLHLPVHLSHEDSVIEVALSSAELIACSLEEDTGPRSVFKTVHSVAAQEPPITPPFVQPLPPLQREPSPGPAVSLQRIEELLEDMVWAIRWQTQAINHMSLNLSTQMDLHPARTIPDDSSREGIHLRRQGPRDQRSR
ncbi:Hypothetical predicted protein [Pelobates cultripes]|uniref:Uncharacterized protein n=1 Tax=Pelobates cultripes TaxID=61616 RepID=A0AAD1W2P5_PELCU|nr:Hypothetical predicted protein [Pelobates cultripes]